MKDEMLRELDKDFNDKNLSKEQYERFRSMIIGKADQLDKLRMDHDTGKISDDDFFRWNEEISNDMRKIGAERRHMVDKNIDYRKKKVEGKFGRRVLLVVVLLITVGVSVWFVNYSYAHRSIEDIPEPIQVDYTAEEREPYYFVEGQKIGRPEYHLRMQYIATYDIKGVVVASKHYGEETAFDKAFPVDLGLAWGEYAANRDALDCSLGYRKLTCYPNREVISRLQSGRGIFNLVSNNHLTPANEEIYHKLMSIKDGNYVELKGYLISISLTDSSSSQPFEAVSSTTRKDSMSSVFDTSNTGCELIYVTSVEWLD